MPKNPIDRLIEAKEAKIASAERTIGKFKIEIAALREAKQAVSTTIHAIINAPPRKRRSISEGWKRVLAAIALKGADGCGLDEISAICVVQNIDLKRPTLRAQMSNYVKRGYLGRTGKGHFFIALHGLQVAGLETPPNTQVSGESRKETGTLRKQAPRKRR